jgi:hypothetical protein
MVHPNKKEYEQDLPVLAAIGVAFLVLGILAIVPPTSDWFRSVGNWFVILLSLCIFAGMIMVVIAIALYYQKGRLQSQVIRSINSGDYGGQTQLNEMSDDFGLAPTDMRRLLVDLRMAGRLRVSFDSKTGEVIFPGLSGAPNQPTTNGFVYCSFCGLQLSKDAQYCPGCGANLH